MNDTNEGDAMDYVECEIWVCVDEADNYTVATEPEGLEQPDAGVCSRIVKLTVKVPRPKPVELLAVVADEPTTGEVTAV